MRIFRHNLVPGAAPGIVVDMVLCYVALLLAASSLTHRYSTIHTVDVPELPLILVGATIFSVVMALMYAIVGLYRPAPISPLSAAGRTVFALAVGAYITSLSLRTVADRGYIEQLLPAAVTYLVVGLVFVRAGLVVMRRVAPLPRVLIVGTGPEALALAHDLKSARRNGRDVVGLYATSAQGADAAAGVGGLRVFGREQPITELVSRHDVQEIIVAVREQRGGGVPMDDLLACRISGVPVRDLAAHTEATRSEVPIDSLKGSWLVYGHGFVQGQMRQAVKRAFDIASSALLLTLLSPLMLLTAVAIKLESPGPVLYRQERVGLRGRSFLCTKFRSMCVDAEGDGVARWAIRNDPRITRIGALLRKSRIDELPQLWSVLTGEMSLVGPRPERPAFVEELKRQIPFYEIRHTVKPGITGWAQVRYHYGESMDDAKRKHQFDLYYVKNNSLLLDLLVLVETVSVIAFREGQ
ncbi:MAG TPA: TIGR03013 family PEP-CTERM/XrtA system glycosyltransferase [Rubrivivax sp.]|nr:TIGR03013 family PEP-CTERM/XrtA system glycosyltransferase [Rubrivivax sp.]HPO19858.1 TIGR03013 family PEP-CTERM/XrtA system glycosyltransferase [Rubrivivax sp.]